MKKNSTVFLPKELEHPVKNILNQIPKLYTCRAKCANCMRLLGETRHLAKELKPKIPIVACIEHPDTEKYGFVLEWELEE